MPREKTASEAVSSTVLTTVREIVERQPKPVRHADVVRWTGYPGEVVYIALQRLAGMGAIAATFDCGGDGVPAGTPYSRSGVAQ